MSLRRSTYMIYNYFAHRYFSSIFLITNWYFNANFLWWFFFLLFLVMASNCMQLPIMLLWVHCVKLITQYVWIVICLSLFDFPPEWRRTNSRIKTDSSPDDSHQFLRGAICRRDWCTFCSRCSQLVQLVHRLGPKRASAHASARTVTFALSELRKICTKVTQRCGLIEKKYPPHTPPAPSGRFSHSYRWKLTSETMLDRSCRSSKNQVF